MQVGLIVKVKGETVVRAHVDDSVTLADIRLARVQCYKHDMKLESHIEVWISGHEYSWTKDVDNGVTFDDIVVSLYDVCSTGELIGEKSWVNQTTMIIR